MFVLVSLLRSDLETARRPRRRCRTFLWHDDCWCCVFSRFCVCDEAVFQSLRGSSWCVHGLMVCWVVTPLYVFIMICIFNIPPYRWIWLHNVQNVQCFRLDSSQCCASNQAWCDCEAWWGSTVELRCYVTVKMVRTDMAVHDFICGCEDEQLESCWDPGDAASPRSL